MYFDIVHTNQLPGSFLTKSKGFKNNYRGKYHPVLHYESFVGKTFCGGGRIPDQRRTLFAYEPVQISLWM